MTQVAELQGHVRGKGVVETACALIAADSSAGSAQGERGQVGGGPLWHDSGSTAHPDGQVADAEALVGIFLAAAATGWA
ncbi:hypothetical protein ACQEV9_45160 [Streptomyces chartreusis]|uniref:hypothetical protein n=1 Tax=Streptomyces chartreusis TaxID=1969 RepID=UPI003D9318CE